MTADVTGYSIEPPIILGCFLLATLIQLLKDEANLKINIKYTEEKRE